MVYVDFEVWDFARRGHLARLSELVTPPAMGLRVVCTDGETGGPFDELECRVVGWDAGQNRDQVWVRCPLCERCQNATKAGEIDV